MTETDTIKEDSDFRSVLATAMQETIDSPEAMAKVPGILLAMIGQIAGTLQVCGLSEEDATEFMDKVFKEAWDFEKERTDMILKMTEKS